MSLKRKKRGKKWGIKSVEIGVWVSALFPSSFRNSFVKSCIQDYDWIHSTRRWGECTRLHESKQIAGSLSTQLRITLVCHKQSKTKYPGTVKERMERASADAHVYTAHQVDLFLYTHRDRCFPVCIVSKFFTCSLSLSALMPFSSDISSRPYAFRHMYVVHGYQTVC